MVYALIQRKHSTAHYFDNNNTLYILGGNQSNTTQHPQFASSVSLLLNKSDLSVYNVTDLTNYPSTIGHTSHFHAPSNSIVTVFGLMSDNRLAPPLSTQSQTDTIPTGRYHHSSVLYNNTIYVIGGTSHSYQLIQSNDTFWKYDFITQKWNRLISIDSMAGHVTALYQHYLISCFGQDINQHFINSCTWIDTQTLNTTKTSIDGPSTRIHANIAPLSTNEFLLFGGEKDKAVLDDMWTLQVHSPYIMSWNKINTTQSFKRSGQASAFIKDKNLLLYHGGQDGPDTLATDPIYFNLTNMEWVDNKNKFMIRKLATTTETVTETPSSLSGGAISGIVIAIIAGIAICIGCLIWKRKKNQRKRLNHETRGTRFSRSLPIRQSVLENNFQTSVRISIPETNNQPNQLFIPEFAHVKNMSTRISTISFGSEFRFSTEDFQSLKSMSHDSFHSKEEVDKAGPDSIKYELNSVYLEDSKQDEPTKKQQNRTSGFKRLSLLNLFSSAPQDSNKKRRSSLFPLRSSNLLQPPTPRTPANFNAQSRVSIGGKSVNSIQWVGFNDSMDYNANGWRNSAGSSLHLAVKNPRSSQYYSDSSTQSTPKSPMFPHHLRDSVVYHSNELNSKSSRI